MRSRKQSVSNNASNKSTVLPPDYSKKSNSPSWPYLKLTLFTASLTLSALCYKSVFPSTLIADASCINKMKDLLTAKEIDSLGHSLCSPSNAAVLDLVRSDRLRLRLLERREFLHELRSYRLSGLICNDHTDQSVPPVNSEVAFKCLPKDYRKKACMDGRTGSPDSCSVFRKEGESALDKLKNSGPYTTTTEVKVDCDEPGAKCSDFPVLGTGTIVDRQLSNGLVESELLRIRSDGKTIWTPKVLDYLLDMIRKGQDISPPDYPGSHNALERAFRAAGVKNKRVLVIGSISPWVESLALFAGATAPTLTVDYNEPVSTDTERLQTQNMRSMLEDFETFPLIVSYSSIEHDGQGRYGDPLDPDGDLAAMKETWIKLDAGGTFLLGVPFGRQDKFSWFSQRKYAQGRLPLLTKGWEYHGLATSRKHYEANETFEIDDVADDSPVLILRKPVWTTKEEHDSQKTWLDEIDSMETPNGLKCTSLGKCGRVV